MKKKIGLLLVAAMVFNTASIGAFAASPLKNYSLYDDVMNSPNKDQIRERVMDEFVQNSLRPSQGQIKNANRELESISDNDKSAEAEMPKSRNQDLRESSRNVYADPAAVPGWEEGPSYYENPSLDSIIEKYRRSDFAGCMQESVSYVRQNPNDTLGFYYLAMSYTKVNDKDNAIRAYEKVISLNDNPMIVKYATNGRNCVMGNSTETCYPNVNEPEYLKPYENAVNSELTPVDPQDLIDRNLTKLKEQLATEQSMKETADNGSESKINVPFGRQDEKLDEFIEAPYGNGLSPELDKEYKQLKLRQIQDNINNSSTDNEEQEYNNLKDVQKFDDLHSDAGMIKLAMGPTAKDFEAVSKDPEFIKQKQELEELRMMFGTDSKKNNEDVMNMIPYMTESGNKISPEMMQAIMMKSVMTDISM